MAGNKQGTDEFISLTHSNKHSRGIARGRFADALPPIIPHRGPRTNLRGLVPQIVFHPIVYSAEGVTRLGLCWRFDVSCHCDANIEVRSIAEDGIVAICGT